MYRFPAKNHRPVRTRAARLEFFGAKSAWAAAFMTAGIIAAYAVQMSAVAAKGYQVRRLESEVGTLRQQADKTEIKLVAGRSVKAVEEKVRDMGLIPTTQVEYVVSGAPVAMARK